MPKVSSHPSAGPTRDDALALGAALRARRKSLGISMTAAAEAAHLSRVTWHRLEKGVPTVAFGSLLAAARVLGRVLRFGVADAEPVMAEIPLGDFLPLRLRLDDYPQLRGLAWQVADGTQMLSPREALGLYERNWRHLQLDQLEPRERALLKTLRDVYGADDLRV